MSNIERLASLKSRLTAVLAGARKEVELGMPTREHISQSYTVFSERLFRYNTSRDIIDLVESHLTKCFGSSDVQALTLDVVEECAGRLVQDADAVFAELEQIAKACEDTQKTTAAALIQQAHEQEPVI